MSRFSFAERAGYDNELVEALFDSLPRDYSSKNRAPIDFQASELPLTYATSPFLRTKGYGVEGDAAI